MLHSILVRSAILALLPATSLALPAIAQLPTTGTTNSTKVIFQDFADPGLLHNGNKWYAFATNNYKSLGDPNAVGSDHLINVQVAQSADFASWKVTGLDALPQVGAWVNQNLNTTLARYPRASRAAVWAPKVIKNNLGQYVLHYSASVAGNNTKHCIGAAVAPNATGPYKPRATPLACPLKRGGAIDSSTFRDIDGSLYLVYKIDGNSIGHGGSCGNMVAPIVPTPIMLQRLADDGFTPIGAPVEILNRSKVDGPLIEAPSLMRTASGSYVLFYSSNCYVSARYDVAYAFSKSLTGPYVRGGPMMVTGTNGLYSPGGADASADGRHMVFHAGNVGPNNLGYRGMYATLISIDTADKIVDSSAVRARRA